MLKSTWKGWRHVLIVAALFFFIVAPAANDNPASDAASMGMGGVSVVGANVYAGVNNPALTPLLSQTALGCSYSRHFSLQDAHLVFVNPTPYGSISGYLSSFGSSVYREIRAGGSYARLFGDNFSASLGASILGVNIPSTHVGFYTFSMDLGLWARLSQELSLGFHLDNFVGAKYKTLYYEELIPVNMKLGFTYQVHSSFRINAEVESSSLYGTSVRGGIAYYLVEEVVLRAGAASNPVLGSIGLGVKCGKIKVDVAAQALQYVGKTGGMSIVYTF